jgi:hypothetical protein
MKLLNLLRYFLLCFMKLKRCNEQLKFVLREIGHASLRQIGTATLEVLVAPRLASSRPSSRGACPASPESLGARAGPSDAIVLPEIGAPSAIA